MTKKNVDGGWGVLFCSWLSVFNLVMFYFFGLVLVFGASKFFEWGEFGTVFAFVMFTLWYSLQFGVERLLLEENERLKCGGCK